MSSNAPSTAAGSAAEGPNEPKAPPVQATPHEAQGQALPELQPTPEPRPVPEGGPPKEGPPEKKDPSQPGDATTLMHEQLQTLRKLTATLGELETSTWSAETPRQLNLQIVLRRTYETNIAAAHEATANGNEIASAGRNALRFAIGVAFLGWLGTIFCVVWHTVKGDTFVATSLWPGLVATSGAVLLLVGIATITFRVAQRAHDRSMSHHESANRTRKLEAAVRLLTAFEGSATTAKATQEFATKMLEGQAPTAPTREEISALPEAVSAIVNKGLETVTTATKELGEIARAVNGK